MKNISFHTRKINSKLNEAEDWISDLDKVAENTQSEQ